MISESVTVKAKSKRGSFQPLSLDNDADWLLVLNSNGNGNTVTVTVTVTVTITPTQTESHVLWRDKNIIAKYQVKANINNDVTQCYPNTTVIRKEQN